MRLSIPAGTSLRFEPGETKSVRLVEIAADLERELGKPVTSSNHALAWHCLRLAGIEDQLPQWGRLFTVPLQDA